MAYKLFFTPEAVETFEAISAQILERWGEKQLSDFKDNVSGYLKVIGKSPFIYPMVSDNYPDLRKCIFHKNCSILYKVVNKTIHIICFWDNRQEPGFH